MSLWSRHKILETNSVFLSLGIVVVILIGLIVEVIPQFYLKSTFENVQGVRPYTPLELAGFNIYKREGCYNCHSQMVRPLRDEVERYGPYSLASESQYDHPFQWGSRRTGPDLAREGNKNTDKWHQDHLRNPRSVVPASIMPSYPWLEKTPLRLQEIAPRMKVQALEGVPYTPDMIAGVAADVTAQATNDADTKALLARYPNAKSRDYDGNPDVVTEADALIAYLQVLGTMVDFTKYDNKHSQNLR